MDSDKALFHIRELLKRLDSEAYSGGPEYDPEIYIDFVENIRDILKDIDVYWMREYNK